jgi:hypothetical protein
VFGFAQWDSPVALLLEALLSIAIMIILIFVVRRVNAHAEAEREKYVRSRDSATANLQETTAQNSDLEDENGAQDGSPRRAVRG